MSPAITARGVSQSFRQGFWLKRKNVLRDLSFEVSQGSVFGLIGANGSGKTTLIHLMVGILPPESGQILVHGDPAHSREARRRIGFLPERPYFHGFLTGREFLETMAALSGVPGADRAAAVGRALERVGMSQAANQRLGSYSKGMLQRIGIAQAVLHDPAVLILDEPMSGLDPLWRRYQRELISQLGAEGKTILFSSHSIEDVEELCDSAGMIHHGGIVLRGQSGWPALGTEIVASGIDQREAAACCPEGSSVRAERACVRVVLTDRHDPGPVLEHLVRKGARVRSVHPSPVEWEDGHARV